MDRGHGALLGGLIGASFEQHAPATTAKDEHT
jgi:hypothetical protein